MKPKVITIPYSVAKLLLFVSSIFFTCVIAWLIVGKETIQVLAGPLICAIPVVCILSSLLKKRRGFLGAVIPVLPVLMIPLLLVAFWFFAVGPKPERSPQDMFKTYLVDPIPIGVTNIQGRYLQWGIFEDVVITFQASPEAIDTIITQKQFERDEVLDGHTDQDLLEYSWKGNWIGYERSFYESSGGLAGYIDMWFDPEQSTVIVRLRR